MWVAGMRLLTHLVPGVKYHHPIQGFNSRLDTLQAVVLRAKLRYLREWNEQRQAAALRRADPSDQGPSKSSLCSQIPGSLSMLDAKTSRGDELSWVGL